MDRIRMKKEYSTEELLHKAASYCSTSEHCISEVEEKLTQWGACTNTQEGIISRLLDEKFIDENRFSLFFVKDKFRFNKWGKIKISYALKQKGLSNALITSALESIDEEEYMQTLTSLLKSKLSGLKYQDDYDKQGKLFRFAQGRGFENIMIQRALRALGSTSEEYNFEQ